jgi:hypothetical protein
LEVGLAEVDNLKKLRELLSRIDALAVLDDNFSGLLQKRADAKKGMCAGPLKIIHSMRLCSLLRPLPYFVFQVSGTASAQSPRTFPGG